MHAELFGWARLCCMEVQRRSMIVSETRPVPSDSQTVRGHSFRAVANIKAGDLVEAGFELPFGLRGHSCARRRGSEGGQTEPHVVPSLITPTSSLDSRVSAPVELAEQDANSAKREAPPEVLVTMPPSRRPQEDARDDGQQIMRMMQEQKLKKLETDVDEAGSPTPCRIWT